MGTISEFYANKTILITGGTGFIGKVVIEKLLFSCPKVKKIYLLMRAAKGKNVNERLDQMLDDRPFAFRLNKNDIVNKVVAVDCNLIATNFNLPNDKYAELCSQVNVVFHIAASVKFEAPLEFNIEQNVVATQQVLEFARACSDNLASFVHVSTAYSNCQLSKIDECVYPISFPANITQLHASGDLLDGRPNSYTLTKAMAENVVAKYSNHIRNIAIARPSIVMSALSEPYEGWVDTINGPVGLSILGALGILQTLKVNSMVVFDLIPVDTVANSLIAIGWAIGEHINEFSTHQTSIKVHSQASVLQHDTSSVIQNSNKEKKDNNNSYSTTFCDNNQINQTSKLSLSKNQDLNNNSNSHAYNQDSNNNNNNNDSPVVFNLTTGTDNPCSFHRFFTEGSLEARRKPSMRTMRPILSIPRQQDWLLGLTGQKKMVMKAVNRMHHANDILHFFCSNQWHFETKNVKKMYDLCEQFGDKSGEFACDSRKIDWSIYARISWLGCRRFILKEGDENFVQARNRYTKLLITYYVIKSLMVVATFLILRLIVSFITTSIFFTGLAMIPVCTTIYLL